MLDYSEVVRHMKGTDLADNSHIIFVSESVADQKISQVDISLITGSSYSEVDISAHFQSVNLAPHWIVASSKTDLMLLIYAQKQYPNAGIIFRNIDDWILVRKNQSENQHVNHIQINHYAPNQVRANSNTTLFNKKTDNDLINELCRIYSWGNLNEHQSRINTIENDLKRRSTRQPDLIARMHNARQDGLQISKLLQELNSIYQKNDETATSQWIELQKPKVNERVFNQIEQKFSKLKEEKINKKISYSYKTSLKKLHFEHHHPNSIRHLAPSNKWTILIDETGNTFSKNILENPKIHTHKRMGRVVALVIPASTILPPSITEHASSETNSRNHDQMVRNILNNSVGVFGFTVKDPYAEGSQWINHIKQLILWVILQLPKSNDSLEIVVKIEKRGTFENNQSVAMFDNLISGELAEINPDRFSNLNLSCTIMDKKDPLNGYVDMIAYTWGSEIGKERLKRTKWQGHCLLQSDQDQMERLYLAINRSDDLPPEDWYKLCAAQNDEPEDGLLHEKLIDLGKQCSTTDWFSYLKEVQNLISLKNFRLNELGLALDWLNTYKPSEEKLPASCQLLLASARLSLANHRGIIDQKLKEKCIDLAHSLFEEIAPACCESILRVATFSTNHMDFDYMKPEIKRWLDYPVATVGILNHGKLHSTMGQLLAFGGDPQQAILSFDLAINWFQKLSDKKQQEREVVQTQTYRLFCQLDDHSLDDTILKNVSSFLQRQTNTSSVDQMIKKLAASGNSMAYRHHLFLRTLFSRKSETKDWGKLYWEEHESWIDSESAHPWPLIQAYRGWLANLNGDTKQAGTLFNHALNICFDEDHGPTLHWMGHVLHSWAMLMGIKMDTEIPPLENIIKSLHEPATQYLLNPEVSAELLLQKCLPFNFH